MFTFKTSKGKLKVRLDWSITKTEAKAWLKQNFPEYKFISVEKK